MGNVFVPVSPEEADLVVRHVAATLLLDGLIVTEDEKETLRKVAIGEIPYEDYLRQVKES